MPFASDYLAEVATIALQVDVAAIDRCAELLAETRANHGRLFILGVGGSAANASHAVNDFRKLAGIEAYAPTDNVAELTARTNDEGWISVFANWLETSRLGSDDLILVLSVGGGRAGASANLIAAIQYAHEVDAKVIGIVGRTDGYTASAADACIIVPVVNQAHVTPHAESFQSVICHLLAWHPELRIDTSVSGRA